MNKFHNSKNLITKNDYDSEIDERLLLLVPLVQVAWAHGIVSAREKRLIFEAAREDGIDERNSLNETLHEWLVYQPSRRFFNDCLEDLSKILRQMSRREREHEAAKLMSRCTSVAGATGDERFDEGGYISAEELQSLTQITTVINYRRKASVAGARS